jgi:hypothetical protein
MADLVFICGSPDGLARRVMDSAVRDQADEVARQQHVARAGADVFSSWALEALGGTVASGDEAFWVTIPADRLDELPDRMAQYEGLVGVTLSLGVGATMRDATRAMAAARKGGGDQVRVYDESVEQDLGDGQPDHMVKAELPGALLDAVHARPNTEPLDKDLIHDDAENPRTVWRVQARADAPKVREEGVPWGAGPYGAPEPVRSAALSRYRNDQPVEMSPQPGGKRDFYNSDVQAMRNTTGDHNAYFGHFLFGFEHPDHARAWFGDDNLETMRQHGWELMPVPARKVFRSASGKQIAFLPHTPGGTWGEESRLAAPHRSSDLHPHGMVEPARPQPKTEAEQILDNLEPAPAYVKAEVPAPQPDATQGANGGPSEPISTGPVVQVEARETATVITPPGAAPLTAPPPADAGPTLQDRLRTVALARLSQEAAQLQGDRTGAAELRERLAGVLKTFQGKREELAQLVQVAPGMADVLTDLLATIRDVARALPAAPDEPEAPEPVQKAIGGSEKGREHLVLPVGAIKHPPGPEQGRVKVATPGGEGWRQVRSGMVAAPNGTPTSARNPSPKTGELTAG